MTQVDPAKLILAGAAALFFGAAAFAQAPPASPPPAKPSTFKNLKIFQRASATRWFAWAHCSVYLSAVYVLDPQAATVDFYMELH